MGYLCFARDMCGDDILKMNILIFDIMLMTSFTWSAFVISISIFLVFCCCYFYYSFEISLVLDWEKIFFPYFFS